MLFDSMIAVQLLPVIHFESVSQDSSELATFETNGLSVESMSPALEDFNKLLHAYAYVRDS